MRAGSGKTTLMDILALRHISGAVTGSITTNGRPVSLKFVQKRAYVPQVWLTDRGQHPAWLVIGPLGWILVVDVDVLHVASMS